MKRLWKTIPPCLSDVLGFEAVLNQTGGLGIIDDPSTYKPLRIGGQGGFGGGRDRHGPPDGGFGGGFGGRGGRGGRGMRGDTRVICSDIRNGDIISGTEAKLLQAFDKGLESLSPDFVLLSFAPSSSMINSDLDTASDEMSRRSSIPCAAVKTDGEKDYIYGISLTLEAMGRLLTRKLPTVPGSVNILGGNVVDWSSDTLPELEAMLAGAGLTVISRWGLKETTENLRRAASAEVNWVVNVSGLRLARWMQQEYGIRYVVGAPFGSDWSQLLLRGLKGETATALSDSGDSANILIVGEQLTANAIRQALLARGMGSARVLSFFEMDRDEMLPGDAKLTGEDDFAARAREQGVRLIIADPDYRPAAGDGPRWISLPNGGNCSSVNTPAPFLMAGSALDAWLDGALR